jgi:hypothetical protein
MAGARCLVRSPLAENNERLFVGCGVLLDVVLQGRDQVWGGRCRRGVQDRPDQPAGVRP